MKWLAPAIVTVAAQYLLGWGVFALAARLSRALGASRRTRAGTARAERSLRVGAGPVAALLGASLLVGRSGGSGLFEGIWAEPATFLLAGALPTASCCLTLAAAVTEARGRWRAARQRVRVGGFGLLAGTFGLLVLAWADLILRLPFRQAVLHASAVTPLLLAGSLISLGGAAFVAALAALSGKPRPSGPIAVAFYVAGLAGLIATGRLAAG